MTRRIPPWEHLVLRTPLPPVSWSLILPLLWLACGTARTAAAEPEEWRSIQAEAEQLFAVRVRPLFVDKCGGCHGEKADERKGGFDMRSRGALLNGGESGDAAIVPGRPDESFLMTAIRRQDGVEMPPKENDRLTDEQIAWVGQWISGGAPWPSQERIQELLHEHRSMRGEDGGVLVATSGGQTEEWNHRPYQPGDLWAYQPVRDPDIPWEHSGGSSNPIDAFINRRLSQAELPAAERADRLTLIRRATFDLTGLPPTPEEVEGFVSDDSDDAYVQLIDRLLKSDRYGEQWARHWLDVVRYADSSGFSNDFLRPNAWRYRDYVIRSFNADKPYDQFLREQIAGDELYDCMRAEEATRDTGEVAAATPPSEELLIASGFLRMGPWEHTAMSVAAVTRQQFLDDVTNSVGVTFLAQELRCAKCHDHKFDPIPTRDYYRFQAAFAPVQSVDREVPYLPSENTDGFEEGQQRINELMETGGVKSLTTLPKDQWPVAEFDTDTDKKGRGKVNAKRSAYLKRELKRFSPWAFSVYSGPPRDFNSNTVIAEMPAEQERTGLVPAVHVLTGGAIETPAEPVTPGVLSAVDGLRGELDPRLSASIEAGPVGRRIALADWMTLPENPLTARVMVNRIWQSHFGKGLAANPNNFGKTGKPPTHPELLDSLASSFVRHDWSVKQMHRLIMLSQAYQRSGRHPDAEALSRIDPENELLAVFSPRRLTAEELRDAMLAAAGELNLTMGGIPARPEINFEVAMQPRHVMGSIAPAYQPDPTPAQRHRRTIYAERIRTLRDPLLEVFNQPGLDTSCEHRDSSNVTPQVFTLLNSRNSRDRAIALALRLEREGDDAAGRIDRAFRLLFGRGPTDVELHKCRGHFEHMIAHHEQHTPPAEHLPTFIIREMVEEMTGLRFYWVEHLDVYEDFIPDAKPWNVGPETRALAEVCLVLFNSNEFIYVY